VEAEDERGEKAGLSGVRVKLRHRNQQRSALQSVCSDLESKPRPDWNTRAVSSESRLASEPREKLAPKNLKKPFPCKRQLCSCWWVHRLPQVETETAEDKLAAAHAEAAIAESGWNEAVIALRAFNLAHQQNSFSFQSGGIHRVQTFTNNAQRSRLEADVRAALTRRNAAWAARAELLLKLGVIR
jgi:hypothetical protein